MVGFQALAQGQLGEIRVAGAQIKAVYASLLDQPYALLPDGADEYWGVVVAPLEADPGDYRLSVLVQYQDGTEDYFPYLIEIVGGAFVSSSITLPLTISRLSNPDVQLDELAQLSPYLQSITPGVNWKQTGLLPPPFYSISSSFGAFRQFNGSDWQRHTGVDYPTTIGSPIPVMASGQVVLVGRFPIRGNYVLVDHGAGLFSGYAHLSQVYVTQGQQVAQGDLLGEVGSTGRSAGPHLHWEVALGGTWVNPVTLLALLPLQAQ
jgi:murein DD-endopeptidase MepM/ murein hydrolase activator NlpD